MLRSFLLAAVAATSMGTVPVAAAPLVKVAPIVVGVTADVTATAALLAKRGADDKVADGVKERRGRGRDDGAAHAKQGRHHGVSHADSAKRRPRTPGGSGCDSPRDLREHPECRR